jgi:tripartite-type tricarboxylate transporter receptor subunit TctC
MQAMPSAQAAYPDKPIKLVVGYPPGGAGDTVARLFAQPLAEKLGQPVVVENKPGAGSVLAAQAVTGAPADGYTLLFTGNSMLTVNPYTFKSLPYDPRKGFTPLATVAIMPLVLLTTPNGPASVAEYVAKAKAEPGKWSFGSYGLGNAPHFAGEMLNRAAGIQAMHVPFSGSGPNLTALLGGQIPMAVDSVLASAPHIKAGKLKPLATFAQKRLPNFPDVPTIGEAGYAAASLDTWLLFLAPPRLPAEQRKVLEDAFAELVKRPDIAQKIVELNLVPHYDDGARTQAHIETELGQMKDIAAKAGIQPQ